MKKIPTLYERVYDGHKIIGINPVYTSEECRDAFLHGEATIKWDGSCCAFIDGVFYKRYDAKNGKPIPENAIKCQEQADPMTGHLPCWVPISAKEPSDKWFIAAYQFYRTGGVTENVLDGTFEVVGKHFQANPYNLTHDTLIKHGGDKIQGLNRDFDSVREYLTKHDIEGIVFWQNGKPVCKIKRSDFGLPWGKNR